MIDMQEWFIHLVTVHPYLVYGVVFFVAAAEGPIISILLGVLIKLGYFAFLPSYAAVIAGDMLSDTIWYYVGYYFMHVFVRRFGKYFGVTEDNIEKVKRIFNKYNAPILFVSKVTNGFGLSLAVLLTAGTVRIPFGRFISVNFIGQFVWSGFLIAIGYFFSDLYLRLDSFIGHASVFLLFGVVVVAFLGFARYLRKRVENQSL